MTDLEGLLMGGGPKPGQMGLGYVKKLAENIPEYELVKQPYFIASAPVPAPSPALASMIACHLEAQY